MKDIEEIKEIVGKYLYCNSLKKSKKASRY